MYRVVTHFDTDRFIPVLFKDRAGAQKFWNRATAPSATEGVVSIAIFNENKLISLYTPITDPELIERPRGRFRC